MASLWFEVEEFEKESDFGIFTKSPAEIARELARPVNPGYFVYNENMVRKESQSDVTDGDSEPCLPESSAFTLYGGKAPSAPLISVF